MAFLLLLKTVSYSLQWGNKMKRILTTLLTGAISTFTMASVWQEQQLPVQRAEPVSMGAPVVVVEEQSGPLSTLNGLTVAFGYAGAKIGSDEIGGDEKFNGFFLNASTDVVPNMSVWAEYAYQTASDLDLNGFDVGVQYKLFEDAQIYSSAGIGLGYLWIDGKGYDSDLDIKAKLDLSYFTLPINVEVGYKVVPNASIFANLGYKWYFNQDGKVCMNEYCASAENVSDLDMDGVTYKVGLRYKF